jgi:mono/diheme cytochrome c family protein
MAQRPKQSRWLRRVLMTLLLAMTGAAACRQDMHDQPRYESFERSDFFADGASARAPIPGTVARGQLSEDEFLTTGKQDGAFVETFPFPVSIEVMRRGRARYEIFCAPCHGRTGDGSGMVVQRGYRRPPSFHADRLRNERAGYLYDVITSGFGAMPDYAAQIPVADRWAIVAYIRALQLSQNATLADVPATYRGDLEGGAR